MFRITMIVTFLLALAMGSFAAPVEVAGANITMPDTNELPSGQATFYDAGLGACGITNNGEVEDVVALSKDLMGAQSNGNPFCGRTVVINYGGKTASGIVRDKCQGCARGDIDLSKHLFQQLADFSVGRLHGVSWNLV